MILNQKVFEPKYIKFSKRLIEQRNTFSDKWPIVKQFISNMFQTDSLINITSVQEIIRELCYKNFEKEISLNLSISLYQHFNRFLKDLEKNNIVESVRGFYIKTLKNLEILSQVMQYFQVTFLINKEGKSIKRLALNIFHNEISNQHLIEEEIIDWILSVVEQFREDVPLVMNEQNRALMEMTIQLGMFKKSIESQLIQKTKNYYQQKRSRLPNNIFFLKYIDNEIIKQTEIMNIFKPNQDLVKVIEKQLITENIDLMIDYFEYLLNENKFDELRLLWKFFNRVGKIEMMHRRLEELILDYEKYLTCGEIEKLMLFKQKVLRTVDECFESNRNLITFVLNSFENIFSRFSTLSNQIMSDYFIQTYSTKSILEEYKEELPFEMFKINPSKDLLVLEYQSKLAKYILLNIQVDLSRHLNLITKIKDFCGGSITRDLENMLKDVWHDSRMIRYNNGNFWCKLISKSFWPSYDQTALNLPDQLRYIRDDFEDYYLQNNFNKKLVWLYRFGEFVMSINNVNFTLSQIQASIVIYLSKSIRPMKKQELIQVLKISSSDVLADLDQLKRIKLVIQHVNNKSLEINLDGLKPYRYTKKYQLPTTQKLTAIHDRGLTIEACLMRLLKKNKQMSKNEVIKQIPKMIKNFRPTIEQINNSITKLAEKDFLATEGMEIKYIP